MHPNPPTLRALSALTAAAVMALPTPAQATEIEMSWTQKATHTLPPGTKTILVRRIEYRNLDPHVVRDQGRAYYRHLLEALRTEIRSRAPQIQILDDETAGLRGDYRDEAAARGEQVANRALQPDLFIVPYLFIDIKLDQVAKQKNAGKQVVEGLVRRHSGGLIGGGGSREVVYKRVITVAADMNLQAGSGQVLVPYGDNKTSEDETKEGWFGGGQRTAADFEAHTTEIHRLIGEHARQFVGTFLGGAGTRRFLLVDLTEPGHRALVAYKEGEFMKALNQASTAWHASKEKDHAAAFVAALSASAAGKQDWVLGWLDKAIDTGTKRNADVQGYREARSYLEGGASVADAAAVAAPQTTSQAPAPAGGGLVVRRTGGEAPAEVNQPASAHTEPAPVSAGGLALPPELLLELRKAAARRLLDDVQPNRLEDLVQLAVREWLQREEQRRGAGGPAGQGK